LAASCARNFTQRIAVENGPYGGMRLATLVAVRLRNEAARRCAHADDVHCCLALARHRQRTRDVPTPGLAVGNDDEGFRVRRLAKQLFVSLDELQPPIQTFLDVRIPRRIVLQPKW